MNKGLSEWESPNGRVPKRPAKPGTTGPMNQSSPNTHCHFLTLTLFCPCRSLNMSRICFEHHSVSSSVFRSVSSIHPRTSFCLFHPLSPFPSFFSEITSF